MTVTEEKLQRKAENTTEKQDNALNNLAGRATEPKESLKSRDIIAVEQLIANMTSIQNEKSTKVIGTNQTIRIKEQSDINDDESKVFSKYKIKDIVFLAIMAAAMLVTGAIMPLVGQIPLFGIVQLCLGLQFSIFPVIGMMKVRKPGSLLFISLCCGVLLIFMNTIMFFCLLICAFIAESVALLVFRGYKKDGASLLAGTLYFPLTLPFLYIWYKFIYTWTGEEGQAVSAFIGSTPGIVAIMSVAVIVLCFVGSFVGMIIAKELKKSGVMKK